MACEQRDLLQVRVLSMRREVPHLHVLGHATSKPVSLESSFARWVCVADNIPFSLQRRSGGTDWGWIKIQAALANAARRIPLCGLVHSGANSPTLAALIPTCRLGLAALNGVCYFSAHEHALRDRSRRGQTVPSGTGDSSRAPRPETQWEPNDNGGIAGATRTLAPKARPAAEHHQTPF
jgi:hypothetical protein